MSYQSIIHNTDTLQNNPYLEKNVQFADCIAYITKHGYIRRYKNLNVIDKNKCPLEITSDDNIKQISIMNLRYNDPVNILNLTLPIGEDITETNYCGLEGSSIAVNVSNTVSETYYKCFDSANNIRNNNPYPDNQFYTFESCKTLAVNKGNNYFGLYETDQNGFGKCIITDSSSSFDIAQSYDNNYAIIEKSIIIPLTLATGYTGAMMESSGATGAMVESFNMRRGDFINNSNNNSSNVFSRYAPPATTIPTPTFPPQTTVPTTIPTPTFPPQTTVPTTIPTTVPTTPSFPNFQFPGSFPLPSNIQNLLNSLNASNASTTSSAPPPTQTTEVINSTNTVIPSTSSQESPSPSPSPSQNFITLGGSNWNSIIDNINIPNNNKTLNIMTSELKVAPPIVSVYFLNGTLYACDSTTYDPSSNLFGYYGTQYNCSDPTNNCSPYTLQINTNGKLEVVNPLTNNSTINNIFDPNIASVAVVPTVILPGNNQISHKNGLNQGEYIISSDKRFKIVLTMDGLLKYVYYIKSDICRRQQNGQYIGNTVDNISGAAIYNIPTPLYPEPDMCNISAGYVSGSGQLYPYTKESYAYGDNYSIYNNSDLVSSAGVSDNIMTTSNIDICKQTCNTMPDCGGFTYDSSNTCTIKSGCLSNLSIIPSDPAKQKTLQIRNKSLPKNKITQKSVSLETYNSFTPFEPTTLTSDMQFIQIKNAETTPVTTSILPLKTDKIMQDIINIEKNKEKINLLNNNNPGNIMESMINKSTIDGMMNDGELINLQSKYINICWSILAIGTVIFTIANIKK
jgi:hypothetical protein